MSDSETRLTAVLGPTNTGKTHLAMERLIGHRSGMIGFPLRLLARDSDGAHAALAVIGELGRQQPARRDHRLGVGRLAGGGRRRINRATADPSDGSGLVPFTFSVSLHPFGITEAARIEHPQASLLDELTQVRVVAQLEPLPHAVFGDQHNR